MTTSCQNKQQKKQIHSKCFCEQNKIQVSRHSAVKREKKLQVSRSSCLYCHWVRGVKSGHAGSSDAIICSVSSKTAGCIFKAAPSQGSFGSSQNGCKAYYFKWQRQLCTFFFFFLVTKWHIQFWRENLPLNYSLLSLIIEIYYYEMKSEVNV